MGDIVKCPKCGTDMQKQADPDITIDVCMDCGGIFLDSGELNVLATGMAGNIEYCSVDSKKHDDDHPLRTCGRCRDSQMWKVKLLGLSDIIFDYCPECSGFFLDKDELHDMNRELTELSGIKSGDELREYRGDHLVTIYKTPDLYFRSSSLGTVAAMSNHIFINVYFKAPLEAGLRIFSEKWTLKISKLFGMFKEQDIQLGSEQFDKAFIIQADYPSDAKSILTDEIQQALLKFINGKPKIFNEIGKLEVNDRCLVYSEGPYAGAIKGDLKKPAENIIKQLVSIVALF
ncbi:zf-TFIIB domain-containing protein [Planctomycetota bacterium]